MKAIILFLALFPALAAAHTPPEGPDRAGVHVHELLSTNRGLVCGGLLWLVPQALMAIEEITSPTWDVRHDKACDAQHTDAPAKVFKLHQDVDEYRFHEIVILYQGPIGALRADLKKASLERE